MPEESEIAYCLRQTAARNPVFWVFLLLPPVRQVPISDVGAHESRLWGHLTRINVRHLGEKPSKNG